MVSPFFTRAASSPSLASRRLPISRCRKPCTRRGRTLSRVGRAGGITLSTRTAKYSPLASCTASVSPPWDRAKASLSSLGDRPGGLPSSSMPWAVTGPERRGGTPAALAASTILEPLSWASSNFWARSLALSAAASAFTSSSIFGRASSKLTWWAGRDLEHLDHGQAELALDRAGGLALGQGEGRVGDLGIGDAALGGVGVGHRLHAGGLGHGGRVRAGLQLGGDGGGVGGGLGRDLHQGALFGGGQGVLAEIVALEHLGRVGGHAGGQGLGAETRHGEDAGLRRGQRLGVGVHQRLELGVGGGGRRAQQLGIQQEIAEGVRLELEVGEGGRDQARRLEGPPPRPAANWLAGGLVAQAVLERPPGVSWFSLQHAARRSSGRTCPRSGRRRPAIFLIWSTTSLSDGTTPSRRSISDRDSRLAKDCRICWSMPWATASSGVMVWPCCCACAGDRRRTRA